MSNPEKSRKPLIVGIVAAVVILGVLLALVLTNCTAGQGAKDTEPVQTTVGGEEIPTYKLCWNVDRAEYDGKSEAGMSSRKPGSDGYFHVRFFLDGQILELKVADRKTINAIDVNDIMDLVFDEDGIVTGIVPLDDVPCEQVGWKFYVQGFARTVVKLNSSGTFNGMEVMLDIHDNTGIYDMTGSEGEVGKTITPIQGDRVIAIADLAGNLTHMFIVERPTYMKSFEAECQHCEKSVEWKMWDKVDVLPLEAGHYQLQNDIQLKTQVSMKEDAKICLDLNGYTVDGAKNARMISLHNVGCELALMDTSEAQTGKLRGHGEYGAQGGIVWLRYGAFYMYSGTLDGRDLTTLGDGAVVHVPKDKYFYMYGGTILGGTAKYNRNAETGTYSGGRAGSVFVQGKFVMYDGLIQGGKSLGAATAWKADGTPSSYQRGYGGNLLITGTGEFVMEGGTIKDGTSTHNGGNIYADGSATITLNDGMITGGKCVGAGRNGGNISISSTKSKMTINGGYILDGSSYNCAGNLYSNGKVDMNGGYIDGGKCRNFKTGKVDPKASTSNVYNVNGQFRMSGGVVTGGFGNIDTKKGDNSQTLMAVGGLAQITSNGKAQHADLTLNVGGDNVLFIVANRLQDSAKIGVNTSMGIFSNQTYPDNLDNFYSNVEGVPVVMYDGRLALGRTKCACGLDKDGNHIGDCDGAELFWAPINTNSIPTGTGNYYLMNDMEDVSQCSIAENAAVRLDLNGHTLTAKEGFRAISLHNPGAYFSLTDSSEAKTGKIVAFGESKTQAACMWVRYGNAVIYQGTLDASGFRLHQSWDGAGKDEIWGTSDDKIGTRSGAAIEVCSGTSLTMYGGTILGGTTIRKTHTKTVEDKEYTLTTSAGSGGAVSVAAGKAVFNMYGGLITGGTAQGSGGNLYIASTATVNLYGGTISGGFAGLYKEDGKTVDVKGTGGSIYLSGGSATLNILGENVLITGGKSIGNGGNLYIVSGTVNMEAGTVTKGESLADQGGNLFNSGAMNLTGGLITEGKAKNGGGNIAINSGKETLLQGVTVTGGVVSGNGGNIRSSSTNTGNVTIAEGTLITGGKAKNGGNISVESNNYYETNPALTWYITGGTIENGEATAYGGNIYIAGGATEGTGTVTLNISGGLITGGKTTAASGCGGNIRLQNIYNTLNITGGTISYGQAGSKEDTAVTGWGGNIEVFKGTVNMSGGTVSGGWARNNGGSIRLAGKDAFMNITAGSIYGGQNLDQGGNIWIGTDGELDVDGTVNGEEYSVQIYNGTCGNGKNGGNIHANANATVTLNGVKIYGGASNTNADKNSANVNITNPCVVNIGTVDIAGRFNIGGNTSTVKMYGKPVIQSGSSSVVSLQLNGNVVDISELDAGEDTAKVGIWGTGKFAAPATEAKKGYFFADDADKSITLDENALWVGDGPIKHCLCGDKDGHENTINGCDGTVLTWTEWTSTTTLPKETGNYILTAEVVINTTVDMNIPDQIINIDLNGQTVRNKTTGQKLRLVRFAIPNNTTATKGENTRLTIVDIAGNGVIKTDANYDQGSIFWLNASNSTVVLLSGKLDASLLTLRMKDSDPAVPNSSNGANAIGLDGSNNAFIMYGGTFIGGNSPNGGDAVFGNSSSSISIYGGTIEAATTSPTGILIRSYNTVTISGGTIGGTVQMDGKDGKGALTLSGAPEIENIRLYKSSDFNNTPAADATLPVITVTGELGNTSPIKVSTMSDATVAITGETVEANADNFASANAHFATQWDPATNQVKLVGADTCICGVNSTDPADHKGYTDPDGNFAGCDGTKLTWTAWPHNNKLPTITGNYYLTCDVSCSQANLVADANVVLDLNGHKVTASGSNRLISLHNVNAKLTVTDLAGGGEMIRSETYTGQGAVIWVRNMGGNVLTILGGTFKGSENAAAGTGNVIQVDAKSGKFYMLGGHIIGGNSTVNGAGVYICGTGSMYMVGGTITGGKAANGGSVAVASGGKLVVDGGIITGGFANATLASGGNGGNIYAVGEVQILKGQVTNGTAWKLSDSGDPVYYEFNGEYNAGKGLGANIFVAHNASGALVIGRENGNAADVLISGGIAGGNGGNIYLGNGNTVNVNSGTITGGTSKSDNGGNIWIGSPDKAASVLNVNGGIISNGTVKNNGGNIHANKNATINLLGGTITGGKKDTSAVDAQPTITSTHAAANINVNAGTSAVTIGSVTVDGYVNIGKVTSVTVTGNPQINTGVTNLAIGANNLVLSSLAGTARVGITADEGVFAPDADASAVANFVADNSELEVVHTENGLELAKAQPHVHCVCGGSLTNGQVLADGSTHTCVDVTWTAADSAEDLTVAGNYYLTKDLVISNQIAISGVNVNLCLNGHNITYTSDTETVTGSRVLSVAGGANVTLTSCKKASANNTLIRVGCVNVNGGVVHVDGGSTLNLYVIKLDASGLTVKGSGGGKHGGALRAKNSTVNMYSGTIVGATMLKDGSDNHGGCVALEGTDATTTTFNMLGGTIRDGVAHQWAGNLYIFQGTFNMYGGEIENGKIGTNVNNMVANVAIRNTGVLNMWGGQIHGRINHVSTAGGKVNLYKSAKIAIGTSLNTNGNTMGCTGLDITIYDLDSDAVIGFCYNLTDASKLNSDYKIATIGEGFVEAEDMAKLGFKAVYPAEGATYAIKANEGKLYAYKSN